MTASEHAPPADPPRVLIDLASLERAPAPRVRVRGPYAFRGAAPPRYAEAGSPIALPAPGEVERTALATLGRLAREGRVVLCTYAQFEPPGPPHAWGGTWREALGEVQLATIEPALAVDALGEDVFRDGPQTGALARLCTRLKQYETTAGDPHAPAPAAPGLVRSLDRFHQLAARVQGDRLADLYHLWSAECAGCPWWLTLDAALEGFLRAWVEPGLGQQPLRCEPVLPNALLTRLGILERDAPAGAERRVVALRPRL
jgi:hypothetical protein